MNFARTAIHFTQKGVDKTKFYPLPFFYLPLYYIVIDINYAEDIIGKEKKRIFKI